MFKHACKLRLLYGSTRIGRHKAGKVLRVGRAVVGANGLDQPAQKKLARIDKGAGAPTLVYIHVGHIHFRERALIHHGTKLVSILVAHKIDDRTDPGIQAKTKMPVLPNDLAFVDGVAGAQRLGHEQRLGARAGCGLSLLVINVSLRHGDRVVIDHLENFLAGKVGQDKYPFDRPAPGMIDAVGIGAIAIADAAVRLLGIDHPGDGDGLTAHARQVSNPVALEGCDDARIFVGHFDHGVQFRTR